MVSVGFADEFNMLRGRILWVLWLMSVCSVDSFIHQPVELHFASGGGLCVKHVDDEASENNLLCDEGFWEIR